MGRAASPFLSSFPVFVPWPRLDRLGFVRSLSRALRFSSARAGSGPRRNRPLCCVLAFLARAPSGPSRNSNRLFTEREFRMGERKGVLPERESSTDGERARELELDS